VTDINPPSAHFLKHFDAIRAATSLGPVVDVACGRGRHTLAAAERGVPVIGIDRHAARLAELRATAHARTLPVCAVRADLEEEGLPLASASCGALLVFRFLHRPLAPALIEALRPGGLLLYETFTIHQKELLHGPKNESFFLKDGELPTLFTPLELIEVWEGRIDGDFPMAVAQLAARKP
jgi:SAM-dependent methyltransferase